MEKCIFCLEAFDKESEQQRRSVEHIIPDSLGGSDAFTHKDCHTKCNNDLGSQIDARLINDPIIVMARMKYALKNKKRKLTTLLASGKCGGMDGDVKISPDGIDFEPRPVVKKKEGGGYWISGSESRAKLILKQITNKFGAEKFDVEFSERELGTEINISMTADDNALCL